MPKAIIIGASRGIGRALAIKFSGCGYEVGLTARHEEPLLALQKELAGKSFIKCFDIREADHSMRMLEELIQEMGKVDLIIINSGVASFNRKLEWNTELDTIQTNVLGCTAMANVAIKYFLKEGKGHLVGISSIASIRGNSNYPAYSASKAFLSNYLQGLRLIALKKKTSIVITDIEPGFVHTDMTKENKKMFWVASAETAAEQIYQAIQRKASRAYITRRWTLIAWLMKISPDWMYKKLL